ncbi:uncharacterized protein LOC110998774 [Pieris rapae]|uniref:uncharacterized protein LOC110998774 n=1 Tax=Pieris rapae TaxID=64459 RepID=UPI001E27E7D6|nr:uncharacterized protein LOC110998774 [Pieris rapae]
MATNLNELYEDFDSETTIDLSSNDLENLPDSIYNNKSATVIYLQNNKIRLLPDDFFHTFLNLKWLDLRGNQLECIPPSIKNHPSLTHLLLQDNKISSLPNELGTVMTLKVLQLNANPLVYPPKEIINLGTNKILKHLYNEFLSTLLDENSISDKTSEFEAEELGNARSYNSVLDSNEMKNRLKVHFNEKDASEYYDKLKGKCPKLAITRQKTLHTQSSKYLQPIRTANKVVQDQRILQSYLKDQALQKRKDFIARADKIIQEKKNMELLRNWRKNYKTRQFFMSNDTTNYTDPIYPYDTNPEYMTFLTREDIEKDLPDKFRKKIVRRSKPTVPRKSNNDVHLAMKIKELFQNLEAIDLQTNEMTPRTEQKILLHEIKKITEIKQKLSELSTTNSRSVIED